MPECLSHKWFYAVGSTYKKLRNNYFTWDLLLKNANCLSTSFYFLLKGIANFVLPLKNAFSILVISSSGLNVILNVIAIVYLGFSSPLFQWHIGGILITVVPHIRDQNNLPTRFSVTLFKPIHISWIFELKPIQLFDWCFSKAKICCTCSHFSHKGLLRAPQ